MTGLLGVLCTSVMPSEDDLEQEYDELPRISNLFHFPVLVGRLRLVSRSIKNKYWS